MSTTGRPRAGAAEATPPAASYKAARNATGITIAEWEWREGLPLFSVWPEAEHARVPPEPGNPRGRRAFDFQDDCLFHGRPFNLRPGNAA